jgi:hypothetical protein
MAPKAAPDAVAVAVAVVADASWAGLTTTVPVAVVVELAEAVAVAEQAALVVEVRLPYFWPTTGRAAASWTVSSTPAQEASEVLVALVGREAQAGQVVPEARQGHVPTVSGALVVPVARAEQEEQEEQEAAAPAWH